MKLFNWLNKNYKDELAILVKHRPPKSKKQILNEGEQKGYNKEIVELVINFILDYPNFYDGFPINYSDDILLDYTIDDEDLSDFYTQTLKKMKVKIPKRSEQKAFMGDREDYPVSLVIEFLEWCVIKKPITNS